MTTKSLTDSHFKEFDSCDPKYFSRYKAAGIPKAFWDSRFSDYKLSEKPRKLAKAYVRNFPKMEEDNIGLLLLGREGTGKSMLAGIICKYVSALYAKHVRYVTIDDVIPLLNKSWIDNDTKLKYDYIVKGTTLLVLDNIPVTASVNRDVAPIITEIIQTRLNLKKLTILTSRLNESQLSQTLSKETVKLFTEACVRVSITAETSYREVINKSKAQTLSELIEE